MIGEARTAIPPVSEVRSTDSEFLADVIAGLSSNPRTLPCKYFYDERGAALFQQICELPEYYITRTEIDILDRNRVDIASRLGRNIELIGLGTGAGTKTRILIEALSAPLFTSQSIFRKNNCVNRPFFSGKFFRIWKSCQSVLTTCNLWYCLHQAAILSATSSIFRDRRSATSSRTKL